MRVFPALVIAIAMAAPAAAQDGGSSAGDPQPNHWRSTVRENTRLFVTLRDGMQIEGRAVESNNERVLLRIAGTNREIPLSAIGRIEKPDPVGNGAAIGLAVGGGLALVTAAGSDCNGCTMLDGLCAGVTGAVAVASVGLGALIGWGLDAAIHRRQTVYVAGAPARVSLAAGPSRLAVKISW